MNDLKKLLILILSVIALAAFAACDFGGGNNSTDNSASNSGVESVDSGSSGNTDSTGGNDSTGNNDSSSVDPEPPVPSGTVYVRYCNEAGDQERTTLDVSEETTVKDLTEKLSINYADYYIYKLDAYQDYDPSLDYNPTGNSCYGENDKISENDGLIMVIAKNLYGKEFSYSFLKANHYYDNYPNELLAHHPIVLNHMVNTGEAPVYKVEVEGSVIEPLTVRLANSDGVVYYEEVYDYLLTEYSNVNVYFTYTVHVMIDNMDIREITSEKMMNATTLAYELGLNADDYEWYKGGMNISQVLEGSMLHENSFFVSLQLYKKSIKADVRLHSMNNGETNCLLDFGKTVTFGEIAQKAGVEFGKFRWQYTVNGETISVANEFESIVYPEVSVDINYGVYNVYVVAYEDSFNVEIVFSAVNEDVSVNDYVTCSGTVELLRIFEEFMQDHQEVQTFIQEHGIDYVAAFIADDGTNKTISGDIMSTVRIDLMCYEIGYSWTMSVNIQN